MNNPVSLIEVASYIPENQVQNTFFDVEIDENSIMFKGAKLRHHVSKEETPAMMASRAINNLSKKLNLRLETDVDLLLTNVSLPYFFFAGTGAEIKKLLPINPKLILDVHNAGCVSFVYMVEIVRGLMRGSNIRTAIVCNIQNMGGQVYSQPNNRNRPQSIIPGDGCGVGYLVANNDSPVKAIDIKCHEEYATDMDVKTDSGRKWWEPGEDSIHINFSPENGAKILRRGKKIVPERVREACKKAGILPQDINMLITNQPNPVFLKFWREEIGVRENAYHDTFEQHGNLFGSAHPIVLEQAIKEKKVKPNDYIALGGFSHAGDYSGAAIVHWHPS